jgi:hypothetical protein
MNDHYTGSSANPNPFLLLEEKERRKAASENMTEDIFLAV